MKSKISFFNSTVLRKDLTRFAPAWGLYLTGMLLLMLTIFVEEDYDLAYTLGLTIGLLSIVNICYALVCAALLFGDLFNAKLCNALHAMPMRREGWFVTHLISGLLFSAVPNLTVALCLLPRLGHYWFVAFIWVGGMTATYLFFFGAAVLAALCTGSRFAMVLVYGLINFLSILILWTAQYLYEPLLYGIEIKPTPFVLFSPVSYLCTRELNFVSFLDKITGLYNPNNGWPYVIGIAVVGAVMLLAALILYRKRHLEGAGDFITVRSLSPVFLVLYTLAAGMALFIFSSVFSVDREYLFLAVGIAAGFVTGRMLLKRTVRVFRPATFVGLAVMLAVIFGSLGLTRADVLGITRWVPRAENVRTVSVCFANDPYVTYGDSNYAYTTARQEEILELMALHEEIIGQREAPTWASKVELTYTMQDGRLVSRRYPLDYSTENGRAFARWLSKPEYVLQTGDVAALSDRLNHIVVDFHDGRNWFTLVGEDALGLLDAIIADCEAGNMVMDGGYRYTQSDEAFMNGDITISFMNPDQDIFLPLWSSQENTLAWLKEYGIEP